MRLLVATGLGAVVTSLLLLLMHALVSAKQEFARSSRGSDVVAFTRVHDADVRRERDRLLPEVPKTPEHSPPRPRLGPAERMTAPAPFAIYGEGPSASSPDLAGNSPKTGLWSSYDLTTADWIIPLTRLVPDFPKQARLEGISGWVELEFTVGGDGRVSDAKILQSEPGTLFDTAALRAVMRWRFKPRVVDGKPVDTPARTRIDFAVRDLP